MSENMFERDIRALSIQDREGLYINYTNGAATIHHRTEGFLRSKRADTPRVFKTSDAAIKCLERCGIEGVQVFIKRVEG